jgi:hypothetical protein
VETLLDALAAQGRFGRNYFAGDAELNDYFPVDIAKFGFFDQARQAKRAAAPAGYRGDLIDCLPHSNYDATRP